MTLRPIGPRVLVDPIDEPTSDTIELTDDTGPQTGIVAAVGIAYCPDCAARMRPDLRVGQRVYLRPSAIIHKTVTDGKEQWFVQFEDVVGEIPPFEE